MIESAQSSPEIRDGFKIRQPSFAKCLLGTIAAYVVLALCISPAWENSDDFRMSMIAAAIDDSGESSEMLVYINVVLGHVLAKLYSWMPAVPWYVSMFVVIQIVSQATIFHVLSRSVQRLSLLAVVQFTTAAYFWTHLQFTTTAVLSSLAGAILLLGTIRDKGTKREILGAWILIGLGGLIRFQAAGLVGLLTIPAFGAMAWRCRDVLELKKQVTLATVGLGALFGCVVLDKQAYENHEGWRKFRSVSAPVAKIVNDVQHMLHMQFQSTNTDAYLVQAIEATGMTRDEQKAMCLWLYSPPGDTYTADRVSAASEAMANARRISNLPRFVMVTIVQLFHSSMVMLLLGASFVLVLSVSPTTNEDSDASFRWAFLFIQWALSLGVVSYIHWNMKLPPRVYISVAMSSLFVSVLMASTSTQRSSSASSKAGILAMLVFAGCGWVVFEQVRHSRSFVAVRDSVKLDLQSQLEENGATVVFTVPYPFEWLHPFDDLQWMRGLPYIYLDGHQLSPRQRDIETSSLFYISAKSGSNGARKHLERQFGPLKKLRTGRFGSVYEIIKNSE
jgi:hypothetical protein